MNRIEVKTVIKKYFLKFTQICYATLSILLNQDVFALQISMSNGWFPLGPKYLYVQMCETTSYGQHYSQAANCIQSSQLKIIIQRSHFVIVCD